MKFFDPSMKKGVLSGLKFKPLPPGKEYQAGPVDEGRPSAQQAPAGQARQGEGFNATFPTNKYTTTANMNPELLARLQAMYDAAPDEAKRQIQSSESGKTFLESGYRPDTRKEAEELGMDPRTSQEIRVG